MLEQSHGMGDAHSPGLDLRRGCHLIHSNGEWQRRHQ
jgi:hypothetical protein